MNLKQFKEKLDEEQEKLWQEIVSERGVVNRDFVFAAVMQFRGISRLKKILEDKEEDKPDYSG